MDEKTVEEQNLVSLEDLKKRVQELRTGLRSGLVDLADDGKDWRYRLALAQTRARLTVRGIEYGKNESLEALSYLNDTVSLRIQIREGRGLEVAKLAQRIYSGPGAQFTVEEAVDKAYHFLTRAETVMDPDYPDIPDVDAALAAAKGVDKE